MIQIIEKPDWVSWDDIKQCLYEAHAPNRANGINMTHYQWPSEKIHKWVDKNGVMLVALDGKKLVGTAAIVEKDGKTWYTRGRYAYLCFACVLPPYNDNGIYTSLTKRREEYAEAKQYDVIVFDTHSENVRIIETAKKNGYRLVGYFLAGSKDHFSVVMAKWIDGCPYMYPYCWIRYHISKFKAILKYKLKK